MAVRDGIVNAGEMVIVREDVVNRACVACNAHLKLDEIAIIAVIDVQRDHLARLAGRCEA